MLSKLAARPSLAPRTTKQAANSATDQGRPGSGAYEVP